LTRSLEDLILTGLRSKRSATSRSYTSIVERTIIWDGSVPTSLRRRKRSKLLPLRKKKKIIPLTTELPVMTMTAISTNQKRKPQADI